MALLLSTADFQGLYHCYRGFYKTELESHSVTFQKSGFLYISPLLSKLRVQIFKVLRATGYTCSWLWLGGSVCLLCLCQEVSCYLCGAEFRVWGQQVAGKTRWFSRGLPRSVRLALRWETEAILLGGQETQLLQNPRVCSQLPHVF